MRRIDEVERLRAQVAAISVNNRALVHANEELAGANLSLRSANDELLVGREETESSAEEIKTLNEELQATNEELVTVNEELEATVEELHTSNEDLDGRSHELQRSAASLELQRQASEAARAQIEAILLSMGDALLVVDSHGIPTLTNATYARLFGASDALIVAEDETGQRLPPNQQLNHLTASGAAFRSQFTLAGQDGTRRWFEAAGEPVRSSGFERGGVITIRDVTERSLHHLQEEFLLRASHELRSPLTALLTALQLLAKGAQHAQGAAAMVDGSPTGQRNDLAEDRHFHQLIDVALRQVRRLRVLTNDLLDVGRLQQSKLDLHLEPVDLAEVVAQAVTVAQLEALQNPQGLTKQTLILEVEAGSFTVLGDAVRLEQIILNLLTNAMKYAPDAERIEVRLGRWEEQAPVDEGNDVAPRKERPAPRRYAQLQVQDFGPGIAAEDLPHLFTCFFQSTRSKRSGVGGLGLGLILPGLVRAHDGGITVDSTLGRGTTFTVRLPFSRHRRTGQLSGVGVRLPAWSILGTSESSCCREQRLQRTGFAAQLQTVSFSIPSMIASSTGLRARCARRYPTYAARSVQWKEHLRAALPSHHYAVEPSPRHADCRPSIPPNRWPEATQAAHHPERSTRVLQSANATRDAAG